MYSRNASVSPDVTLLSGGVSQRISLARVLCILGLVYVHVPVGIEIAGSSLILSLSDSLTMVRGLFVEGFGRASAGLLSIISGYLTVVHLQRRGASTTDLFKRRANSMWVPMVMWGLITMFIYALASLFQPVTFFGEDGLSPAGLLHSVNSVFFLTDMPYGATLHLAFLRDLFVCILLSPVLLVVIRCMPTPLLVVLLLLYMFGVETLLILRPLVLLGFAIGMVLAVRKTDLASLDDWWLLWCALTLLMTVTILQFERSGGVIIPALQSFDVLEGLLYPLLRLFGSLAVWTLTAQIRHTALSSLLRRCSPFIFICYCSHFLVLTVIYSLLWRPLAGTGAGITIAWFLFAPLIALISAIAFSQIITALSPGFAKLLNGGRSLPYWPRIQMAH